MTGRSADGPRDDVAGRGAPLRRAWTLTAALAGAAVLVGALVGVPRQLADAWSDLRDRPGGGVTTADLDRLGLAVDIGKYSDVLGPADVKDYRTVTMVGVSDAGLPADEQRWLRHEWNSHDGFRVVALASDSGRVMAYTVRVYSQKYAPQIPALGGQLGLSTFESAVPTPEDTGTGLVLESRDAAVYANTTAPLYTETYHIANPARVSIALSQGGDAFNDDQARGDLDSAGPAIADLVYSEVGKAVACAGAECREAPTEELKDFRAGNKPDSFWLITDGEDAESTLDALSY